MNDDLENLAELANVWVSELIRTCVKRDLLKLKDLIRRRKIWRSVLFSLNLSVSLLSYICWFLSFSLPVLSSHFSPVKSHEFSRFENSKFWHFWERSRLRRQIKRVLRRTWPTGLYPLSVEGLCLFLSGVRNSWNDPGGRVDGEFRALGHCGNENQICERLSNRNKGLAFTGMRDSLLAEVKAAMNLKTTRCRASSESSEK